jgi:photosystem II stability/assembly factor-like uncharacterized protein
MKRPSAARCSVALGVTAALVLLAAGSPGVPLAASARVAGPGELVRPAGSSMGPESEPDATVDAGSIADLPTADNQQHYAEQAAALPGAYPGIAWKNEGPFGQDDPADSPNGALRFARNAGMGVAVAVDPRDPTGDSFYVGNMGGLWYTTDGGGHWKSLSDGKLTRSAVGAIAVDPKHPTDLYVGTGIGFLTVSGDAPGSGIWVSHDAGQTFTRPAKNIRGYAVNDLAVTDDGVLAATTNGLYVSTDSGATFDRLVVKDNATHDAAATGAYANWFSSIAVSPINAKDVVVAVGMGLGKKLDAAGKPLSPGNGIYRSSAGVAGPFAYVAGTSQLQHSLSTADPVGRIMLSWAKASTGDGTVLWALVSDAGLAYGLQPGGETSDTIEATTGNSANATGTELNGLYRSVDGGDNWLTKATPQSLESSLNDGLGANTGLGYGIGVQAYYNLWVQADPRDADQVYFGLEEVFQSTGNTGATPGYGDFEIIQRYWDVCGSTTYFENLYKGAACPDATPYYGGVSTHPDQHVGEVYVVDGKLRLYTGNDGGFFREDSHDLGAGREGFDNDSWTQMNTLATVQPWKIARKPDGEILTALQDNGSGYFPPGKQGILVGSGDGVNVVATPDPDVWYMSAQGDIVWVTTDHGKTIRAMPADLTGASFLSPLAIDPTDPNHLAVAGRDIHETTKGKDTQTTLNPLTYEVITTDWKQSFDAGTSPVSGGAYGSQALAIRGAAVYDAICGLCRNSLGDATKISGTVATNVKPGCEAKKASTDCWHIAAGKGLPHNSIWNVAIDPTDVNTIYVALNSNSLVGLSESVNGAQRVMVSHDAGESFSDLTGNLPHSQARDVVVRGDALFVATDNGVFTAPKTGKTWMRVGTGLPQVRVNDLDLDSTGRYLTAGVFGRGAWVLDFKSTAPSSSGPGPKGEPTVPKVAGNGQGLPATGANAALGAIAALLLVTAFAVRRRSRAAA